MDITPTEIANWIINEIFAIAKKAKVKDFNKLKVTPERLMKILTMLKLDIITRKEAKEILREVQEKDKDPVELLFFK
jgi:Asp-tRNA(Asn)/Glu-tRNA(Gln) amidotransferase B subunit